MGLLVFCGELSNSVFFNDNACCLSEYQSNNALHDTFVTSTMRCAIGETGVLYYTDRNLSNLSNRSLDN